MFLNQNEPEGHRKYLTATERTAFLKACEEASRDVRTSRGTGLRLSISADLSGVEEDRIAERMSGAHG